MANRSGGVGVGDVDRLQEARKRLEEELGFPVAASIGRDLRLLVFPKTKADSAKLPGYGGTFKGFPIEERETPRAQ
jgi:hypothetical protein